jgi:hypothetical protein
MVTLLLIAPLLLTLAGFAVLIHSLRHVVDGYEDESGFHEGVPEGASMVTCASPNEDIENSWQAKHLSPEAIAHHGIL